MPVRVLLVEDSPIALTILNKVLNVPGRITVVGQARTGVEALALIPKLNPDVICTDLHMPEMDGLELTRTVMTQCPRPILVISNSVRPEDTEATVKLLAAGAVELFPKPRIGSNAAYEEVRDLLIRTIEVVAGVSVFKLRTPGLAMPGTANQDRRSDQRLEQRLDQRLDQRPNHLASPTFNGGHLNGYASTNPAASHTPTPTINPTTGKGRRPVAWPATISLVVIGASTGGPQAIHHLLTSLPANFPAAIVCIQHISLGFLTSTIAWMSASCRLPIEIAPDGGSPQAGRVYFAPESRHLEFDGQGRFRYGSREPVGGHCPAVNVTFSAAAQQYGRHSLGILLTGMGCDGATGLLAIHQAGGQTIAQDETTSIVFGMPKEAIQLGAAQQVLSLDQIGHVLRTLEPGARR